MIVYHCHIESIGLIQGNETGRLFNDESYHVEYYNNNGFFMVTIYNANYGKNGNVTENVTNVTKT